MQRDHLLAHGGGLTRWIASALIETGAVTNDVVERLIMFKTQSRGKDF
jgi:hypothetical protein